jgi:SAM-dependent methyltransferase
VNPLFTTGRNLPALLVVNLAGLAVNAFLFRSYREKRQVSQDAGSSKKWEFSPDSIGGFSYWRLFLVSTFSLFFELLVIRWISSELTIFAYFKNFVLIACFLGFGLGCYMCRRSINFLWMLLPLLAIVLMVKAPWEGLRHFLQAFPSFLGALSETPFWGVTTEQFTLASLARLAAAVSVVIYMFALIAFVFVPVGQLVGWFLEEAPQGILGYSINILGSLAGIVLYTALCFAYQPPAVWMLVAGVILTAVLWKVPRLRYGAALGFGVCVLMAGLGPGDGSTVYWSPYQKLSILPVYEGSQVVSYQLNTNDNWYQQIFNLSPEFVAGHPELFKDVSIGWNAYNLPYRILPHPHSVLVLGSGTGNDVAAALRNGAHHVVAVEIDPLILGLGRKLHFEQPYQSPLVTPVLDDARSYLQNSSEKFDLIMFSLLDSHTTSSHFTNIRIDNYVYTREALQAAKAHLAPDGLMVVKFWVATPWIAGRLDGLLTDAFGRPPLQVFAKKPSSYSTPGTFFVAGSQAQIAKAFADPALAAYVAANHEIPIEKATLTTDDWPYFYQREPGLVRIVVLISALLILLCWLFLKGIGMSGGSVLWHFFFLGAGFLLLEAQIVSKMALLFGTTWAVNSIAIGGLLILIVMANLLADRWPGLPIELAYFGMLGSILVSYFVPLQSFFFPSIVIKAVSATFILCLPVFFAGIIFIKSFAAAGFRGEALGSNLLGALVGGLLESLSYWTGIRSLLVVAAVLYFASWVALRAGLRVRADVSARGMADSLN